MIPSMALACDSTKLVQTCLVKHTDTEQLTPIVYQELVDSHCFDGVILTAEAVNDMCIAKKAQ